MFLLSFLVLAVTVMSSLVLPFISHYFPENLNRMKIRNAVADVSGFDIAGGEIAYLSGDWDFFWKKRLVTDNCKKNTVPDAYINIPNSWTDISLKGTDETLKNGGYASYRITLKGVPENVPVTISVPNLVGTYNAFIDGKLVCHNDDYENTLKNRSGTGISANPVYLNYSKDGTYEVVIEVSCDYAGGLTSIPQIASYSKTQNEILVRSAIRYFYVGIIAFFALITVVFSFIIKGNKRLLWLAVLCITVLLRVMFSNEGFLISSSIFFPVDYEIVEAVVYVTTYIIKLSLFMHIVRTFDIKVPTGLMAVYSLLFMICAFVPYFIYNEIYISRSFLFFQSVVIFVDVYVIFKFSEMIIDKTKYALLYLIGYCILMAAITIDDYALVGNIAMRVGFILPVSFSIYIVISYIIQALRLLETNKAEKRNAELSRQIAELNNTLMLSQIQPHFLYNALNTIKYLVRKDPKTAESVIVKFSSYLRANMDSLTHKEPIPLSKEIEHVKNYTEIEKIRFGERLNVNFDIKCENFSVPPLTVQPIVENAIKHGVNQKPEGGTVNVSTFEDDNNYYIEVSDDGVGFDVDEVKDDGRSHVGISNIKERLKTLLNADVSVESDVGKGTDILIKIPRGEQNENNGG